MRHCIRVVPAAAALLLAASPALAQDDWGAPERPSRSFALGLAGSPTLGVWQRLSPRVQLGLEVGGSRQSGTADNGVSETTGRSWVVSVGPALKLYGAAAGPVRPYLWTALNATFGGSTSRNDAPGSVDTGQHDRTVGGQAGLGAEWSPHPRVSIGGHAGVAAGFGHTRYDSGGSGGDAKVNTSFVNTFSSGIRVQFYF